MTNLGEKIKNIRIANKLFAILFIYVLKKIFLNDIISTNKGW